MFELDQEYVLPDGRILTVLETLGEDQGATARVFKVRVQSPETGSIQILAAKEPRGARNIPELEKEADVLQRIINNAYRGDLRPPVPRYASFERSIQARSVPGTTSALLMELIDAPLLSRSYRRLVNSQADVTPDLANLLEAERMGWKAALQYLAFLGKLLTKVKVVSGDRKDDTFYWQYADNIMDGKLIILDWNQFSELGSVTVKDAYNAVRLLAQNWYVMFTGFKAINIQPRLADERWGNLSLGGRDLLLDLLNRETFYYHKPDAESVLDEVEHKLKDLLRLIEDRPYRRQQIELGSEVAADIGRRDSLNLDDCSYAHQQYERWLSTQQTTEPDDTDYQGAFTAQLTPPPSAGQAAEYIAEIRRSIVSFRNENQAVLRKDIVVKNSLDLLIVALDESISCLNSSRFDIDAAEKLNQRVNNFKRHASATLKLFNFEEAFAELHSFTQLYHLWANVNNRLRNELTAETSDDLLNTLELFKAKLSSAPPSLQTTFGLSPEAIDRLLEWLETKPENQVTNLYPDFIDACTDGERSSVFRTRLIRLMAVAPSPAYVEVLQQYEAALNLAEMFRDYRPYTRTHMYEGLHRLGLFVEQFPELRQWARDLGFVRTAVKVYRDEQRKEPQNPVVLLFIAGLLQKLAPV